MIEFALEDLPAVCLRLDDSLSIQMIQQCASQYSLVLGSIAEEAAGVIQDPAEVQLVLVCPLWVED